MLCYLFRYYKFVKKLFYYYNFSYVPGCSGMFRIPGFIDARIWVKVPHENHHFKITIIYFSYIKERLFVVKGEG